MSLLCTLSLQVLQANNSLAPHSTHTSQNLADPLLQLSTHGLSTAFTAGAPLPQRVEPRAAPDHGSGARVSPPLPAIGSGPLTGLGSDMRAGGAIGLQLSQPDGQRAAAQPSAPPQSGLQQLPKRHSDASEQHVVAVLRQLLPVSESEAVALTSAFDRALDVRLHPRWLHDRSLSRTDQ